MVTVCQLHQVPDDIQLRCRCKILDTSRPDKRLKTGFLKVVHSPSVEASITHHMFRWTDNVIRMQDDCLLKQVLYAQQTETKRCHGEARGKDTKTSLNLAWPTVTSTIIPIKKFFEIALDEAIAPEIRHLRIERVARERGYAPCKAQEDRLSSTNLFILITIPVHTVTVHVGQATTYVLTKHTVIPLCMDWSTLKQDVT